MYRARTILTKLQIPSSKRLMSSASANPKLNDDQKRSNRSFMANIFKGEIESKEIFPYPDVISTERKEFVNTLIDPFEKFFLEVNDPVKNDDQSKIDDATLDHLWDLGAFGIQVPEELGGLGLSNTEYGRMCEIVGANDLGVGITIGAHQSIGFKGILLYGTQSQKEKYLPQVSSGKTYAAFALTEPSSGSDAASIKTAATLSEDGKHYILNGSKIWISNGGICEIMTVFARTDTNKLTAFIVERSFGGVSNGAPEKKMGIKCSNTAEVYFDNCKVPIENVLGEVGEGFKVAMNILNNGRFGMGATLAGTMRRCIKQATEHANNRTQFGKKIKEYGAIQEKIARMNVLQYATESMAYQISQNMDDGSQDYHLEAAISKVYASESAWYVCDEAIQILGGMGFMKEPGLERVMRDLRIFRIFEGSNDILRLFVALSGIQYAGGDLKELQKALKNPASNLGFISQEVSKRAFKKFGFGGCDLSNFVDPSLASYAKDIAQCIDLFGQTVEELLIKYGKNIIQEQFVLNCLANAAIDIYASTICLSRATRAAKLNLPTKDNEIALTKALCLEAYERSSRNLIKAQDKKYLNLAKKMKTISNTVCDNNGVHTTHII